jgi:hypothetical protein
VPKLSVLSDCDYFGPVLREYVGLFKETLLFYSGFMRKGYRGEKDNEYVQMNAESLKRYAVKPHFISALRYVASEGRREILHWNTVQETGYLEAMGGLPIVEKLSKQEAELQFHGISSLLFEKLWRNNGYVCCHLASRYSASKRRTPASWKPTTKWH